MPALEFYSTGWSNEAGGSVALFIGKADYLLSPATALDLAFQLCRVLETPDAAAALLGNLPPRNDLLSRVQAIGAPLHKALTDGRTDCDGDEPLPDIDRELAALTMRRLLALCGDIEAGLFTADLQTTEMENVDGES
jgi:hypothetical protein